jgi:cobalt-zinc-cadmium efflux system protein
VTRPETPASGTALPPPRAALRWALVLTAGFCLVEAAGGWWTQSLALLSDAGHMLSDVAALSISLLALWLAERPPTARKTFGYHRIEIVAAFVNGLAMWLVVGLIWHEAYRRFWQPPVVHTAGMLLVAAAGLGVNLAVMLLLRRSHRQSLNIRAAFLHVLGDALGSLAALFAAAAMRWGGWMRADSVASFAIGLLILYSSWEVIRESLDILMMGTPRELDLAEIDAYLRELPGVDDVHDLHVWTMTSGMYQLTAHLVVRSGAEARALLAEAQRGLRDRFGINHITVQLDPLDACDEEFRSHARPAS